MIEQTLFGQAHLNRLKAALTAYSLRHRVVADNIANVATEGYRAQEVDFERSMSQAEGRIRGRRTQEGHLPIGGPAQPGPAEIREVGRPFDNGVNDVNVDREMGELVQNDLAFRLATRLLGRKYQGMRTAITGRTS